MNLKELGERVGALRAIALFLVLVVVGGYTGITYFAKASDLRIVEEECLAQIAGLGKAFTEYQARQAISDIKAEMRKVEDRTGVTDPILMPAPEADYYRYLMDQLEYQIQELEKLR